MNRKLVSTSSKSKIGVIVLLLGMQGIILVPASVQAFPFDPTPEGFLQWVNPNSFRTADGLYRRIFYNLKNCSFGRMEAPYKYGANCEGMYVEIAPNGNAKKCSTDKIEFGMVDARNYFLSTERQDERHFAKCTSS